MKINIRGVFNVRTSKLHLVDIYTNKELCGTSISMRYDLDNKPIVDTRLMCKKCKKALDKAGLI